MKQLRIISLIIAQNGFIVMGCAIFSSTFIENVPCGPLSLNPLTAGAVYIGFFTQFLSHSVPPFKHVKAIM